jgi:DNA-nicking Smr family endonuclease
LDDGENDEPFALPLDATIDLHAFAPRDIRSVVEEYVRAAHEAGFREVRLIHGRGTGVQRGIVQAVLERHPLVESFYDAPESHLGATVAVLKQSPDAGQARCLRTGRG